MMGLINLEDSIKFSLIVLIILFCPVISLQYADGEKLLQRQILETTKHKGTIKTIQSENGEVIDCVDIYKQPSFNHPLLKNHTIQIWPSKIQDGDEKLILRQEWNKNGEYCPKGSIPILRSPKLNYPPRVPLVRFRKDLKNNTNLDTNYEYARASFLAKNHGGSAIINVWNPSVSIGELSDSQIWVYDRNMSNVIEAGWIVENKGDAFSKQTRTFLYWTADNYTNAGCYNLKCPGFVQVSSKIAIGTVIKPISTYDGIQYEIKVTITKEGNKGDWWLEIQGERVGYWPRAIFTHLADMADGVDWGGYVLNSKKESRHTNIQMGSGHLPSEGYKKASFFKKLQLRDPFHNTFKDAPTIITDISKPSCYGLKASYNSKSGSLFFYGGPRYSKKCQN